MKGVVQEGGEDGCAEGVVQARRPGRRQGRLRRGRRPSAMGRAAVRAPFRETTVLAAGVRLRGDKRGR
jgi:hypothetical protein